jgi:streptogramin lyase
VYRGGELWLLNWYSDHVVRFDPVTRSVQRWSVGNVSSTPQGLDLDGQGRLWWADATSGRLLRLDPDSDQRTDCALPVGSSPQMVEVQGSRIWYTESVSGTVGVLDPATATCTASTVTSTSGTATVSCRTLGAGDSASTVTQSGTLAWSSGTLSPTVDAGGWTVYQLSAGAEPFDLASSSGYHWVTDQGRQKLVRLAPSYDHEVYLPTVLRSSSDSSSR